MTDIIERAERALYQETLRPWYMLLIQDLVTELKAARAEVERLRAFADELENATDLSSGAPSIVAKSFAAEIRRRLRGEAQ